MNMSEQKSTPHVLPINPVMLSWARDSIGLTQEEVVVRAHSKWKGFDVSWVKSWEEGRILPTISQLEFLGGLYRRPIATFLIPKPPQEPRLPKDFRTIDSVDVKGLSVNARLAVRWARSVQRNADFLFSTSGNEHKLLIPRVKSSEDPVVLSEQLREESGITIELQKQSSSPSAFFEMLRSWAERMGILVLKTPPKFSFSLDEARAFSFVDVEPYIILINNSDDPAARNFSLLHELGHILLRESGVCGSFINSQHSGKGFVSLIEQFCNALASNFLIPVSVFNDYIPKGVVIDDDILLEKVLKSVSFQLKVSKHSVLKRLLQEKLITKKMYSSKVMFWRSNPIQKKKITGISTKPHETIMKSNGNTFTGLVVDSMHKGLITSTQAAEYLVTREKYIPALEEVLSKR